MCPANRLPGPQNGQSTRAVLDGTLCRQSSPLPSIYEDELSRAEAARLGTPYLVSPYGAVMNAVMELRRELVPRLHAARSREEVTCIALAWAFYRSRFEKVLNRRIAQIKEPPGDQAVWDAVQDAFDLNFVSDLLFDVVQEVFLNEGEHVDRVLLGAVVDEIKEWALDALRQIIVVRIMTYLRIVGTGGAAAKRRAELAKMGNLELLKELTKKRTPLSKLVSAALSRRGRSVSEEKVQRIAKRLLERIADPWRLLPGVMGKILKKIGGPLIAAGKVFFTSSRIAASSSDVLTPQVLAIDAAVESAYRRFDLIGFAPFGTISPAARGSTLRAR